MADPSRFDGDAERARDFFEKGFHSVTERLRSFHNSDYPLTIYYAFKQSESEEDGEDDSAPAIASTGWETMLEGVLRSGFQITGTWPARSELSNRPRSLGSNALASSIVLVCRPRSVSAPLATRRDFLSALKRELSPAIRTLQQGNIAPVDLQQAAIGPGMSIFSRYSKVVESDGERMSVKTALQLINHGLDEVLTEQESDFDAATQWALTWFEQNQFSEGPFGDANTLANAKALGVEGLQHMNIVSSRAGKVRLLRRDELDPAWDPGDQSRLTVWQMTQHLVHRLSQGEDAARDLAARAGGLAETARELAYRLYTLCERKGWAEEAGNYNSLVVSWPAIRAADFALSGE